MKILILNDDFPPQSFGGAGFSVFDLACGLKRSGHDVSVITTCRKRSEEDILNYRGLKVFRIFADYHPRWRSYLSLCNHQTVGKVRKIMREINPDIVHANNIHSHLSYHCLKTAKSLGYPLFWTARDVMSFNYDKLATKKYLKNFNCKTSWPDHLKQAGKRYNPLRNFLIKGYLKCVDRIFAVSQALSEALGQNNIKNVRVIHTGIDVDDWRVDPEFVEVFKKKHDLFGKKIIFFGGRIVRFKGLEQINKAMEIIKKDIPEAFLLVAGPLRHSSSEASRGGVGWLEGEALKAAYYAADVVVVPSACLDSFPRSNLEAMACKKPVVATCYGGSGEIVQDGVTGFIVNPFNTELMAEKIIDLLKNPKKAKQFGQAGYSRVKKQFSLKKQIKETLKYYENI